MKDQLNSLDKIKAVDAPPFLFTRIQAKIRAQLSEKLSRKQAAFYLAGLIVIISINVFVFQSGNDTGSADLVREMNLSPANQLYK